MSNIVHTPTKSELKESRELYIARYSPKEIFNKYLTVEEMKRHPEVTTAVKGDRKIKLDILSRQKPKLINIKGIYNHNKSKLASRLNTFHKIFFDNYKNNKISKDQINNLRQENKDFSVKYKNSNKGDIEGKFNDIKSEYEKKNYYVSPLEGKKNIFNGNILLSNKEELKNYILYDLGTSQSNIKSLSFLHKINTNLGDKTSEKEYKKINQNLNMNSLGNDKIKSEQQKEIEKTQNDIINVKDTINSIDEINYFFEMDNRKYLESLKNGSSRGSSAKISTRVNSAFNKIENVKIQYNNDYIKKDNINKQNINKGNSLEISKNNKNKMKLRKKGRNKRRMEKISNLISENRDIYNGIRENNNSNKYIKTLDNNDLLKSPLEKLYDKISTKENLLNYQSDINKYLSKRKYDISIKINPRAICNNFEKTRQKICQSEFLKQDLYLRKQISGNISHAEKVNNKDLKNKKNINHIEDKIIKIYCDINNPRKKEE